MSSGFRRNIADLACRVLQATLPASLRPWGRAIRCETAEIPDDAEALAFALDSLFGLMPRAIAQHLLHAFTALIGDHAFLRGRVAAADFCQGALYRPRAIGVSCAIGATMLGLAYLAAAGAPTHDLVINACALVIGLAVMSFVGRGNGTGRRWIGVIGIALAGMLLATALFGTTIDGVTRWVRLGRLSMQPSLILLPVMMIAFARSRSALATVGMSTAAAAMAIQPDRAMAGVLLMGLAALSIMRRDRHVIAALCASIAGFAATLARTDTLHAAPYAEQILYTSFEVHPLAGAAVLAGSVMLVIPAIVGWRHDAENREAYVVFGTVWLVTVVAAAFGNYPTPVVGYGGSAIIGYALCLVALPRLARADARKAVRPLSQINARLLSRATPRKDRQKNPPFHAAGESLT